MYTGGLVRGRITVDGHPKEQATFARISGYVEQVRRPPSNISAVSDPLIHDLMLHPRLLRVLGFIY